MSSDVVKGIDWTHLFTAVACRTLKLSSDVVLDPLVESSCLWLKVVAFRALKLSNDVVNRYRLDPLFECCCLWGTEVVK